MKNSIFKKSIEEYKNNSESYKKILEYVSKRFDIPKDYMEHQIKKDIYNIYASGLSDSYFEYKIMLKEYLYIIAFYSYLLLSLPFSLIYYLFMKKSKFDIVYEEIWPGEASTYKRFYISIDYFLKKYNSCLLICPIYKPLRNIKNTDEYIQKKFLNKGFCNYVFHYSDIMHVLKSDLYTITSLINDSKKTKINLVIMYLRIVRRILFYKAQTYNVSATVLVGANDYYWNPIKYFIFKNNGFKNIVLLQHNYKHEIDVNSLYIYCDVYFADSKSALSMSEYIIAKEKYDIGNVQLSPFIKDKKVNIEYDIFVVHHPVKSGDYENESALSKDEILDTYEIFLNYLEIFAKKFPNISILYVSKNFKDHRVLYFNENKKRFKGYANIKCVTAYGKETYKYINSSKILINLFSSLGAQAYGLNKRVFWININNTLDSLGLPNTNEDIDVLVESEYYIFEKKLLNLLENDNKEMKDFVENKKQQYMNIQENPAIVVADKVLELLKLDR